MEEIKAHGGAKLIITTAPSASSMIRLLPALAKEGTLAQVGVDGSPAGNAMPVSNVFLIHNRASVTGWGCAASKATEKCVKYSVMAGASRSLLPTVLGKI